MPRFRDLTGKKVGKLLVLGRCFSGKAETQWDCVCDCGNKTIVNGGNLARGHTSSCGCLQRERSASAAKTHGKSRTKTYHSWFCMKQRCSNPNNNQYDNYGGRGISVCNRWDSFFLFLSDMGECPEGMSIDRKDANGNYELSNCKWATAKEQANNKRTNKMITYNDETLTLTEWANKMNINPKKIHDRISILKWETARALTTP